LFEGLEISLKVFKKERYLLFSHEKNDNTYCFIGLGKNDIYKSLKTIAEGFQKRSFWKNVALFAFRRIQQ
jgi:hypothetical protein